MTNRIRFSSGDNLNKYCWDIAQGMVATHHISEHEAVLRVAEFCVKAKVNSGTEDYDIIMHRSVDYWVEGIYFAWDGLKQTTEPKPLPSGDFLKMLSSQA